MPPQSSSCEQPHLPTPRQRLPARSARQAVLSVMVHSTQLRVVPSHTSGASAIGVAQTLHAPADAARGVTPGQRHRAVAVAAAWGGRDALAGRRGEVHAGLAGRAAVARRRPTARHAEATRSVADEAGIGRRGTKCRWSIRRCRGRGGSSARAALHKLVLVALHSPQAPARAPVLRQKGRSGSGSWARRPPCRRRRCAWWSSRAASPRRNRRG